MGMLRQGAAGLAALLLIACGAAPAEAPMPLPLELASEAPAELMAYVTATAAPGQVRATPSTCGLASGDGVLVGFASKGGATWSFTAMASPLGVGGELYLDLAPGGPGGAHHGPVSRATFADGLAQVGGPLAGGGRFEATFRRPASAPPTAAFTLYDAAGRVVARLGGPLAEGTLDVLAGPCVDGEPG